VLCAAFTFQVNAAHAATLSTSPSAQTVSTGSTVTVRVVVNSAGQSINAVSGGVTFSNNLLTLTSISKAGSLVSLWAQAPSYSNSAGTASFQGVILNGFTGSGTILTLTFKAKAPGTAAVSLSSDNSSVLLNDGNGTNVLSGTSGDTITITPASNAQPSKPAQPVVPVVIPSSPATPVQNAAPKVTEYQNPLLSDNFIVIKGTATPNSALTISLSGNSSAQQSNVPVDSNGLFTYVSDDKVKNGVYTVTISAEDGQKTTVSITVKNPLTFVLLSWVVALITLKISIFWIILLIIICFYLWHRNRLLRRYIVEHMKDNPQIPGKS